MQTLNDEVSGRPAAVAKIVPERRMAALRARLGVVALVGAYLGLVVVYVCSFGRSAWHPTDYEYIMATVWRMGHGEVPYRDFIYHKPPGSLWMHIVWLAFPDGWGVLASRVFFYLQIATSGLLPILWALRRGRIAFGWRLPALGIAACALALHNFPVLPWQTSDGIFFSTIGAVALLESISTERTTRVLVARAIASGSFALALLCKQSFFAPVLLLTFVALGELASGLAAGRKHKSDLCAALRLFAVSVIPALAILAGTYLYLRAMGALSAFVMQFRSQSTSSWLLEIGLWHIKSPYLWLIGASALVPAMRIIGSRGGWCFWGARILAIAFLALFVQLLMGSEQGWVLGAIPFFVLLGALAGRILLWIVERVTGRRFGDAVTDSHMILMHVSLVAIAWSTQLSLGYPTPILGVAGLGLILHEVLPEERKLALDLAPALLAAAVLLAWYWKLNEQQPYRDLSRDKLSEDLGRISPRLSGIRTNPYTFARYAELKLLATRHAIAVGKPYAVLQDYPGIHWLLRDRNPIRIDWAYVVEIAGVEDMLWNDLVASGAVAIVPKEADAGWWSDPPAESCESTVFDRHHGLSQRVVREWRLIANGRAFCVYVQ